MKKFKKNGLALITILVVLLIGFFYMLGKNIPNSVTQQTNDTTVSVIQSPSDLNKASQNLDNTNPDSMDTDLNQLNSDSNF